MSPELCREATLVHLWNKCLTVTLFNSSADCIHRHEPFCWLHPPQAQHPVITAASLILTSSQFFAPADLCGRRHHSQNDCGSSPRSLQEPDPLQDSAGCSITLCLTLYIYTATPCPSCCIFPHKGGCIFHPDPHCLTFLSWWCHSVCLSVLCSDLCPG